ncbi:hypothetical protein Clacol_006527 [Clathrus columnatus]|uniref:Cytochrome c oxidase subunit IV n=1 Tax=Clathrus columnatus TaxID=1419009 RepID=A0AAV5ACB0_9AGAM|nr:hypothetical protein Clacol_006527 [Clathrus columnatus]
MHLIRINCVHPHLRTAIRHASTIPHSHPTVNGTPFLISLSNVEAQWDKLSKEDKVTTALQLEELQKRDWKELTQEEKRAIYYVAYGPHGPRTPKNPPGTTMKVTLGTLGLLTVSGIVFTTIRSRGGPPPKTMTKEWQEASNERALAQKANPISGISSEGYKGKGFVTAEK